MSSYLAFSILLAMPLLPLILWKEQGGSMILVTLIYYLCDGLTILIEMEGVRTDKWIHFISSFFLSVFFLSKNGPTPASFSFIFAFPNTYYNFTTNKFEKMSIQYTVPGFELTSFGTWVSSHNHRPECFIGSMMASRVDNGPCYKERI